MGNYSELLKDPRWQKKRLKILKRDKFACRLCGDEEITLHVHHKYYENDKNPWEYKDESLITLCEDCHELEHECCIEYKKLLIESLFDLGYMADDLRELAVAFHYLGKPEYKTHSLMSAIAHFFRLKNSQKILMENCFSKEYINKRKT